jgi:hypothetical protein
VGGDRPVSSIAGLMMGKSPECWDDMVRDELLRDLFPCVELRNCECRRANGTGGGAFLCTTATSG